MKKSKFLSELPKGELFSLYPDVTNLEQIFHALGDTYLEGNLRYRVCCKFFSKEKEHVIIEAHLN